MRVEVESDEAIEERIGKAYKPIDRNFSLRTAESFIRGKRTPRVRS